MSSYSSWSVKGIDDRAREVAKEQARLKGITLGDYINELLLQGHSEAGPRDNQNEQASSAPASPADPDAPTLDGLAQRIEAVEARSTLAITGIDQSVLGLLSRLESSERNTADLATNVDEMISELRDTHAALINKVEQLETTGDNKENLDALKALERAVGKLASHVYEENTLVQEETGAIKARVESGLEDLADRLNFVEDTVSQGLKVTAAKVDMAVSEASRQAGGDPEAVLQRLSEVQALVDNRVTGVEENVVTAINHVEGTLVEVQERLNTAETTTDTALKALEHTFAALNQRIDDVAEAADPEKANLLRKEFEERFENLASDLRASVEETRAALAKEISDAALNADPQSFPALERQLTEMSGQVESQLEALAAREDQLLTTVSEKFNTLADQVDEQLSESEKRNAEAFEQVGEQVASAISRMQARHDEVTARFSERLEAFGDRQDKKLSDALEGVSERLNDMQERTSNAVSPVQRAIATLAARLELIEDTGAAPGEHPDLDLPEMVPYETVDDLAFAEPEFDDEADELEATADAEPVDEEPMFAEADPFALEDETAEADAFAGFETPDTATELEDAPVEFASAVEELATEVDDAPAPEGDDEAAMMMNIAARAGALAGGDAFAEVEEPESEFSEAEAAAPEFAEPEATEDEDFVAGIPGLEEDELSLVPEEALEEADLDERLPTDDTELTEWNPSEEAEDPVFDEPEMEFSEETDTNAFEDAFDLDGADDEMLGNDESALEAFAEDFSEPVSEDPEDVFGGWDDGRDETRENDVFEGMEETSTDDDLAFEDFDDVDDVTALDASAEEEVEASAADADDALLDEDETTDYLDRARNAAIRATNDKSTRFRAHQTGSGGVDRFSAGSSNPRKRMPIILAGAALMVTAAAAAGYVTLRDDLLASDTSFDIQTGPTAESPASDIVPAAAALEEAMADTGLDETLDEATIVEDAAADGEAALVVDEPIEAPVVEQAVETPPPAETAAPTIPQIDIPTAISLEQAAANGNAIAQFQQGERLIQAGDISAGVALIQRSAENGLAFAEHRLAKLHEEGLGVPRDLNEARVWTERAAEGGNVDAMYDLGVFYAEGEGGQQSFAAAAKWFRSAAEFGIVDSQYNLALLFENGLGISPSDEEALYWYMNAARSGDGSAPAEVARLSAVVSPDQVAAVEARSAGWTASTPSGPANGVFGDQVWETSQRAQLQAVQTALNALGYSAGTPDGILGNGTRQAIRDFQADADLTPDGRVSNATIRALEARMESGG